MYFFEHNVYIINMKFNRRLLIHYKWEKHYYYYYYIIITSTNKVDVMWSFCLSFCKHNNWQTQKRTSTKLDRHGQGM